MRPSLRQPGLRPGAIAIALIGSIGMAAAIGLGSLGAGSDAAPADEITGSIAGGHAGGDLGAFYGPVRARRLRLPLSEEQRGHIFDLVMRIPDAPTAAAPAPDVADALPGSVALQDLPARLARDIPLVQGHKFVKFDDRILVVNPANRLVVAMIPRYRLLP